MKWKQRNYFWLSLCITIALQNIFHGSTSDLIISARPHFIEQKYFVFHQYNSQQFRTWRIPYNGTSYLLFVDPQWRKNLRARVRIHTKHIKDPYVRNTLCSEHFERIIHNHFFECVNCSLMNQKQWKHFRTFCMITHSKMVYSLKKIHLNILHAVSYQR